MRKVYWSIFGCLAAILGLVALLLAMSLPSSNGRQRLEGLAATVDVTFDDLGVPTVRAQQRQDAFRVLGYLHARDRLFQMELMRRKSAGRLAELFGATALASDRKQRVYQLSRAARRIVGELPDDQRQVLQAYVAGVNAYLEQTLILPPEFLALKHRPDPWTAEDSLLVVLAMFQTLNGHEQDERMVSIMARALPPDLVQFMTPDTDPFTNVLLGGDAPRRYSQTIPVDAFAALPSGDAALAVRAIDAEDVIAGSNNWAVAGSKTADGRAMIANDMHLALNVPNIWYRAHLEYPQHRVFGVTLPGVPGVIVGGSNHVAWGFTNVTGDFLDLIRLDIDPNDPGRYRTPDGWEVFEIHQETIHVKDAPDETITLRDSRWGPISEEPLAGEQVVVKWAALEPGFVDLGLINIDRARSVADAIDIFNRAGGPGQNVVIADADGHIGWTYMGRFPWRRGFDGLIDESWGDGRLGWIGAIPPDALPRVIDPANGILVTANNRTIGRDYPYVIGHNWALGYRSHRIDELLQQRNGLTERDMMTIQLDTRNAVLDFYRDIALNALRSVNPGDDDSRQAQQALQAWDGQMNVDSVGAPLLNMFRVRLAEAVFEKVVSACRRLDPAFRYTWREMETPLRHLLTERPNGVLNERYGNDWSAMIVQVLRQSVQALREAHQGSEPTQLTWGATHRIAIRHPFSRVISQLSDVLDMPTFESDGCANTCVKALDSAHGASERMVLAPAHPEDALFQMPGGQSGHPLSAHYRDQQNAWREGLAMPMQTKGQSGQFQLVP